MMLRVFSPVLAVLVSACWILEPAVAQTSAPPPEPDSGSVVCTPGAYLAAPEDCLPLGPSVYLTELAGMGLTMPPKPLPSIAPDTSLAALPFRYFHVISQDAVPIGSTPGATAGVQSLYPGFVYIGYADRVDTGHGIYYQLQDGGWIPGRGERIGEYSGFQGLQFASTPRNSFGWTFEDIPVKSAPGFQAPDTGARLGASSIVQVYETRKADDVAWNMVGIDQWVEARKIAQVVITTASPQGSDESPRWIDVNLAEQSLAVYNNHALVFATMIASGMEPFWTRPGLFQIQQKKETETMRNNDPTDFYYLEDVPWTMYFDGPRALHGAYWRTRFGYPQSHGCVNLSVGDAHWLFNWANVGDWVYVHDPTGKTPSDPSLYRAGAY